MTRRHPDRPLPIGVDPPTLRPGEDLAVLFDAVVIIQDRRGYRFGEDAVALARHVLASGPRGPLLEIGTGSGVIPLLLSLWGWEDPIWAVECQKLLADRAARSVRANRREGQIRVILGDATRWEEWLPAGQSFSRIVSNPPFWPLGSGRRNPGTEKEIARHEVHLDLSRLLRTCQALLAPGGLATVLYPLSRLREVHHQAGTFGLLLRDWTEVLPEAHPRRSLVAVDLVLPPPSTSQPPRLRP